MPGVLITPVASGPIGSAYFVERTASRPRSIGTGTTGKG
jgi:hypothetical protein